MTESLHFFRSDFNNIFPIIINDFPMSKIGNVYPFLQALKHIVDITVPVITIVIKIADIIFFINITLLS